jgi:hypothetical protein
MWSISAVPLYLWFMLLLPSAVVANYIAVQRKWAYLPVLSFSLATVVASSAESAYGIFVLKRFDEKFRDAPGAALELSLFGDAVIGFIALLLFGGTVAYYALRGRQATASGIVLATLFGGIYASLPNVLYWWGIQARALLWWIWILIMPLAAAFLTVRQMKQSTAARSLVPR